MVLINIDTIIIGAGIAGLYYAYKFPKEDFKILERNNYIGGRLKMSSFHNYPIVCGAGVGRWNKDKFLRELLGELDIPVKKTINKKNYFPKQQNIKFFTSNIVSTIKSYHKNNPQYKGSFRDIMLKLFNVEILQKFVSLNGYGDFVDEDFRETIYHYGLEDNINSMDIFSVPWNTLVKKLIEQIGRKHIQTKCDIDKVCKSYDGKYFVYCKQQVWCCKNIIIATDISTIHKIFPGNLLYKYISGQSFSRIYVKLDKVSTDLVKQRIKGYTIVNGPLQKIIPMYEDAGIYMIGYNDNQNAKITKDMTNKQLSLLIEKTLGCKVNIMDFKIIFWENGTHYFKPYYWNDKDWNKYMNIMQNPDKNVRIIGEAFSFNQGWVEGALESVINLNK